MKPGILFLAGVMMGLAGCTSNIQHGSGDVQSTVAGEMYTLNLEMDQQISPGLLVNDIRYDVSLYVNGIRSVRGPLHKDGSGSLQGSYEGKPVELDCVKPHAFTNIRCDVHISGRKVDTLSFKPGAR